jgi:hypothetical protein
LVGTGCGDKVSVEEVVCSERPGVCRVVMAWGVEDAKGPGGCEGSRWSLTTTILKNTERVIGNRYFLVELTVGQYFLAASGATKSPGRRASIVAVGEIYQ